jgi:hypothetical protein
MQRASAILLDDECAKVRPNIWRQCGRIKDVELSDSLPAHVQLHAEQRTCKAA